MTTIGSTSHYGAGSYSQRFTQQHADQSASESVFAKLAYSEQKSAEPLESGEATDAFSVRTNDRMFTIAGNEPDSSLLQADKVSDVAEAQLVDETTKTYDFSNMSRQEIADAGKELFQVGKITLDELFQFEHPDGVLRIDTNGSPIALNPDDRIDFFAEIREAIQNMEQTGEATQPNSRYELMAGLLDKLASLT